VTEIHTTADGVTYVRTPEDRFADLPDFAYEPRYLDVDGLRMAYLDEGPADGPVIVLMHGEPTWSFLYRRMLPPLIAAGHRCIAPDLIGFGRSDKPTERSAYSYNGHVAWLHSFLDQLNLGTAALFAQDWGGLIGLRLVAERDGQFSRVAIGNTGLPVGEPLGAGFDGWLAFSQSDAFTDVGALMGRAMQARELDAAEVAGYAAPFPDPAFMAGAIAFPTLVPITPDHPAVEQNEAAWAVLEGFTGPFVTLWCPEDPVLGHLGAEFVERIPGAAGQPHQQFRPGGHFLQDDRGEDVAAALVDWLRATD